MLGVLALDEGDGVAEAGAAGADAATGVLPAVSVAAGAFVLSALPAAGFSVDSLPAPGFILSE